MAFSIHLKLRSFFTLSLILYEAISKLLKEVLCFLNGNRTGSCSGEVTASTQLRPPLLEMGRQRQEQHHHRFRRPSDPDSRPHRLGSRTARNRFSLPLKPLPPPQLHKAEHDDADDAVQKPWNQRPRKPTLLPKATIKIGTEPSRNHHHATNNGEFHDGGGGGDNNNPAPKSLWLRGFSVKSGNFFFVNCLSVGSFLFYLVLVLVSYVELKDSRKDLDYGKLWKPPSNHGFIPCTKPTPNYSIKDEQNGVLELHDVHDKQRYYRIRHILSSKADDVNIFTNLELCKLIDFVNKIHVTGQNGLL
ncbi:hypothetical protein JHK84_044932 [Glycine max]|nr:hypothetical protein JHK86_044821 [Glycine max]KAG4951571.1 hypothetical protein JHK85_045438 [Glycine max]KAG5108025.1 hypothetical protein JHK84_044932 [Glycine max]